MLTRLIAVTLILSFSLTGLPMAAFCQEEPTALDEDLKRLLLEEKLEQLRSKGATEDELKRMRESHIEWKVYTCPSCEKEFELPVSHIEAETQKGMKEITCPYDGTKFIPREAAMYKALKKEPEYISLKSPYEKKEFKAKMDVESVIAGELITDPFTGKKFRYVPELVKSKEEWKTITSPVDGRKFRIRVFKEDKFKEVVSPYDGRKFSPDWGLTSQKDKLSDIENMFSREIPITVSKAIRQFGYELFPSEPLIDKVGEKRREERSKSRNGFSRDDMSMDKNSLSALKQVFGGKDARLEFGGDANAGLTTVPVSDDYILGPGDKIVINLWGNIQQTFDLDIDGEGKIMLPQAGPLYLWGIKFADARKLIKDNLYKYYTNFQINISMGKLRSIKVYILGEAKKPGAYTISSLSTVFGALYQAGGPTKIGSLRNIKLTRANKTEEAIDLYSYLLRGDREQDFKLDSNDTIFIPPIGGVIGIAGNVKRPAIYEIKKEVNLGELLKMAGGISAVGYMQRIQVERIKEHERKIVFDLEFENAKALKKSASTVPMQDGDLVLISAVAPIRHNYVSIVGNIQRPGDYELKPEMKLKDLVDEARGILPGAYLERAELSRFRDDKTREILPVNLGGLLSGAESENMPLKEWDRFYIFTKSEVVPTFFVRIEGAVHRPGEYELTDNMRMSDLIFRAGGLRRTASLKNAEIYRHVLGEGPKVVSVDLSAVFDPRTKENDLYLQEADQLFIREETKWMGSSEITLSGEVVYPGKYIIAPGERLSSVIERAGGFTDRAFLPGAVFTRESVKKHQRRLIKEFIESEQEAMLKEASSFTVGLSTSQTEARKEMIRHRKKQLITLESTGMLGRIVLHLDASRSFENSESNITMEGGDGLHIPIIPSSVQIVGNVYAPGAVTYTEYKGLEYYLRRAGGFTKNADKKGIFVVKPTGEVVKLFARVHEVERGDTIIVPEKFKYKTPPGVIVKDAFTISAQMIVTVAALAAIN